jgi:hypothetical protein
MRCVCTDNPQLDYQLPAIALKGQQFGRCQPLNYGLDFFGGERRPAIGSDFPKESRASELPFCRPTALG